MIIESNSNCQLVTCGPIRTRAVTTNSTATSIRRQVLSGVATVNDGEVNMSVDAGIVELDRGDLPTGYNVANADGGPTHALDSQTFLGSGVDSEIDAMNTPNALGDDANDTDDEDGVTFLDPLTPGTEARIQIVAGSDGFLNAWIDFEGNGSLDQLTVTNVDGTPVLGTLVDLSLTAGTHTITIDVPANTTGITPARFRFTSDDPAGALGPDGHWPNGEVEDYVLGFIGDLVWLDNGEGSGTSNDGIQNGDEAGLAGVTVNLLDATNSPVLDANMMPVTTVTDSMGNYEFPGLPAGDYRVEFVEPIGLDFVEMDQGGDDATDSDANTVSGVTAITNITAGEVDSTIDAGVVEYDRGDLPDGYGTLDASDGAKHAIESGTFLGTSVDGEVDGAPTANASGDDVDGTDDEDGVTFLDPFVAGVEARVQVVAGSDGFLNAWMDFDSDGTLDTVTITDVDGTPTTGTLNDLPLDAGTHIITVQVPADATSTMAARFRFTSDDPGGALEPTGQWDNGEVEDYILGALGDRVWLDNGSGGGIGSNGIQDGSEPGVEGVVVNLLDPTGQSGTRREQHADHNHHRCDGHVCIR